MYNFELIFKNNYLPLEKNGYQEFSFKKEKSDSILLKTHELGMKHISIDSSVLLQDCSSRKSPRKKRKEMNPSEEGSKTDQFFSECVPSQWYALLRNTKGKIKCPLPSTLQKVKRVIYVFRNTRKGWLYIGKTGQSFYQRIQGYIYTFNQLGSEKRAKRKGRKAFLTDIKEHPEDFEVGILHRLKPREDLNLFEVRFIDHKRKIHLLYNDNRGGGGGLAHAEEKPIVYAVPKSKKCLTPPKYYPYRRDERGRIRPALSPGFEKSIIEGQHHIYAIKDDRGMRYIGFTGHPKNRFKQHGYDAEYLDPKNVKKYDPTRKSGRLHAEMAKNPGKFRIGLYQIPEISSLSPSKTNSYTLMRGIGKVEKRVIKAKRSIYYEDGYNCNKGGGGPISALA